MYEVVVFGYKSYITCPNFLLYALSQNNCCRQLQYGYGSENLAYPGSR